MEKYEGTREDAVADSPALAMGRAGVPGVGRGRAGRCLRKGPVRPGWHRPRPVPPPGRRRDGNTDPAEPGRRGGKGCALLETAQRFRFCVVAFVDCSAKEALTVFLP